MADIVKNNITPVGRSNLLWFQYSPGAAGRIILCCSTTSNSVGDWLPNPLPDPSEYINRRFCVIDSKNHMKTEIQCPYSMFWYTRQYPFTRGDNLDIDVAHAKVRECERAKKDIEDNKLLACIWHKPYTVPWFDGKLFTVISDAESHRWLMKRRKELFYRFENSKAYLLRYIPESIHNPHIIAKYKDHPQTVYEIDDTAEDQFVERDYKDRVGVGSQTNITLSNILKGDTNYIWDKIDSMLPSPINRDWCNIALNTWRQKWSEKKLH